MRLSRVYEDILMNGTLMSRERVELEERLPTELAFVSVLERSVPVALRTTLMSSEQCPSVDVLRLSMVDRSSTGPVMTKMS